MSKRVPRITKKMRSLKARKFNKIAEPLPYSVSRIYLQYGMEMQPMRQIIQSNTSKQGFLFSKMLLDVPQRKQNVSSKSQGNKNNGSTQTSNPKLAERTQRRMAGKPYRANSLEQGTPCARNAWGETPSLDRWTCKTPRQENTKKRGIYRMAHQGIHTGQFHMPDMRNSWRHIAGRSYQAVRIFPRTSVGTFKWSNPLHCLS